MNTLVLIGLALVVAGCVLLVVRFAPRARRQFAATAPQPRTVADLVRLREQTGAMAVQPAPRAATPPAARREAPEPRVAPAPAAPQAPPPAPEPIAPAFVPPSPRPTPVAGRVRRESAELPSAPLDGDNAPWQRGARMAVGLGGGQPWREPPAPPAPLRVVPAAEPSASVEAEPAPEMPTAPAELESRMDVPQEPEASADEVPAQPVPAEPVAGSQGVWVEPEVRREPSASVESEPVPEMPTAPAPTALSEPESRTDVPQEPETLADEVSAQPVPAEPVAASPGVWVEPEVRREPSASVESEPAPEMPAAPAPTALSVPESRTDVPQEPEASADEVPAQPASVPAEPVAGSQGVWVEPEARREPVEPVPAEPAAQPQAVWVEPEAVADAPREPAPDTAVETAVPEPVRVEPDAVAEAARPAEPEPEAETPVPNGRGDTETEDATADAVPSGFADEERPDAPEARRRSRQTPDEKAAEQAAADLALLRTFGFADPGLRPDSAPVVEMEHAEEPGAPVEAGAAQPVRYRVVRRDGTVVGGATVTLLDDRGGDVAAGAADAEGRGAVLAPSPGGYVLVSTAAGHQPGAVAITVTGSATETDVLIARSASVSGSVRGEDGPIAGARVTLVQDGEAVDAVDTDADGAYRIGDIGAGEYGLSVAAPGCEPVAALLDVAEEAAVRHDVELEPASPVTDGDVAEDDALSGLR